MNEAALQKTVSERFKAACYKVMAEKDLSILALSKELCCSPKTMYKLLRCEATPNVYEIQRIHEMTGMPIAYMMGGEEKTEELSSNITLQLAIQVFGPDAQVNVAIEEMAELTDAICKLRRGRRTVENVAEEIADVEIMLEQLRMIYKCSDSVDAWKESKLQRLQKSLDMYGISEYVNEGTMPH